MKPRQLDIAWEAPEPFALAIQTSADGDRVALAKAEAATDRELSDLLQTSMPHTYEQPLQSLPPRGAAA
jgi:hypothetical protein